MRRAGGHQWADRSRPRPAGQTAEPDYDEALLSAPRGGAVRHGLADELRRLGGASYARYKALIGRWHMDGFVLDIVRGQADPFAPPARVCLRVPAETAGLPEPLWATATRRRALASYLARAAAQVNDGTLRVDAGGQQVLDRAVCQVGAPADDGPGWLEPGAVALRVGVPLPGRGRQIDGHEAQRVLCHLIPAVVEQALRHAALDAADVRRFVETVEDSVALREALPGLGLVAFVADGAVLARRSGVDDRPLAGPQVVPFQSPERLRVRVDLPHAGPVSGMGVPEGVTLVVGGGFHGKSTLLRALETGVWDHVPGDGRELVAARADTVKIRAEDGRSVRGVDVRAFVGQLPTGADTGDFATQNASGSTSQAASLVEAVEVGARTLLIDEDTAATNLMIRDARMRALVPKDGEPLTPFVDLVRSLHRDRGVSTVLVMGGSGDYIDVADRVVMMRAYRPVDVTARARELAAGGPAGPAEAERFPDVGERAPQPASLDATVRGRTRVKARGTDTLVFGEHDVDLRAVAQLADSAQVVGVGLAIELMTRRGYLDGQRSLAAALGLLDVDLAEGVPHLLAVRDDDFAVPRRFEIAAAINRLRTLRVARRPPGPGQPS